MSLPLPKELRPIGKTDISLPDGTVARLPICHPVFTLWNGAPLDFNFGKKPVLNYRRKAYFAELVILFLLQEKGWDGVWVETYGGTHYLRTMPAGWATKSEHVSIPESKEKLLKRIWKTGKTTACFDVFAWHDEQVLFCEAKRRGKDKLTAAQTQFIQGALACGIPLESFLIVEWEDVAK